MLLNEWNGMELNGIFIYSNLKSGTKSKSIQSMHKGHLKSITKNES